MILNLRRHARWLHLADRHWRLDVLARETTGSERTLSDVEEDVAQREMTRGAFQNVYRGVVSAGEDAGKHQIWSLVYYP